MLPCFATEFRILRSSISMSSCGSVFRIIRQSARPPNTLIHAWGLYFRESQVPVLVGRRRSQPSATPTLLVDAEGHAFWDASQIGIFDTRGPLIQLDVCVPTFIVGRLCLSGWTVVVVRKHLFIRDHKLFGRGVGDQNRALKDDVLVSMGGIPGLVSGYGCLELVDTALRGDFREADDSECAVA